MQIYKNLLKRTLDICGSLCALPFVGIIIVIVAPIIYINDPGPIFYNAPRKGRWCKQFRMFKFRSMYVNAPDIRNQDGSTYNSDIDKRVTKIGHLLRKYSIDEIPQIINVLKGDMSFVGPRPNLNSYDLNYSELPEVLRKRYSLRPGITGYAQAFFRNSISQQDKYELDAWYSENVSFSLDMRIIWKTIFSVIKHKNINISSKSERN